jgi:hypothetical protein
VDPTRRPRLVRPFIRGGISPIPIPQQRKKIQLRERQGSKKSRGAGGDGVAVEPVPEREGDPLPLLPVFPSQRPRPVAPTSTLFLPPPDSSPPHLSLKLVPFSCPWCWILDLIRREFVKKNYGDIKTHNPALPILIRECSGVQPQLWARYGTHPYIPSLPGIGDLALAMLDLTISLVLLPVQRVKWFCWNYRILLSCEILEVWT